MALVDSGQLTARYDQDEISFYVRDIKMGIRPLLTLRLSDHRPNYQTYIRSDALPPSGEDNTNISIEFYKPKYRENGSKQPNKVRKGVIISPERRDVVPFVISSYSYTPKLLDNNDIEIIYNSILKWINGGINAKFVDPFANTTKKAYPLEKLANIKIKDYIIPRYNIIKEYNQNNCNRNMRNKKVVRLTESDLHNIIAESVSQILNEDDYWNNLGAAVSNHLKNNPPQFSLNPIENINNSIKANLSPSGIKFWKALFGLDGGDSIENYIKGATENLQKLQQSGALKADQNLNAAVQNCLNGLQNFGKQAQQIKTQIQQNTQPQSQSQSQLQPQQESVHRFKKRI